MSGRQLTFINCAATGRLNLNSRNIANALLDGGFA